MRVAVQSLDIEKPSANSTKVLLTLECSDSYEAAVLYEDLVRVAKTGRIALTFNGEVVEETTGENGCGNG